MKPRIPRRRSIGPAQPETTEPPWLTAWQLPPDLSPALRGWLLEPGLLTDRIAIEAAHPATLIVRSLHWDTLSFSQGTLLNVYSTRCFVREITLSTGQRNWIFAQTLVPESKHHLLAWLLALGGRSLGEALAECNNVTQGPFEFICLPPDDHLAKRAALSCPSASGSLWARRRWIGISAQRLLLQEVMVMN